MTKKLRASQKCQAGDKTMKKNNRNHPDGSPRLPDCKCLSCGYTFNTASDPFGGKPRPKPGDLSICLKCGHLMAFNADGTVRELTGDEMIHVAGDKRILAIQEARGIVNKK